MIAVMLRSVAMQLQVFSLFDRAALQYGHPFYAVNAAVAHRMFYEAVAKDHGLMAHHPEDFELRQIAVFDDETGEFKSLDKKVTIASALAVSESIRADIARREAVVGDPDPASPKGEA